MTFQRDGTGRRRAAIAGVSIVVGLAAFPGCGDAASSGPASKPVDDGSMNSTSNPDPKMNQHATGHGAGDGDRTPNRLVDETSPYLLQHAWNPVDWRPWGPEAFEEARRRDVPIIVSIGYSTCYWCHVMEHKVFEHQDVAEFMNANFINIKVDREERPDLDKVYMDAVQAMVGRVAGR